MTKILITILLALTQLHAIHLYILTTDNTLGKLVIESGDYVVLRPNHPILTTIPFNVTPIACSTTKCVEYEIERIEHNYRSSKLKAIIIK